MAPRIQAGDVVMLGTPRADLAAGLVVTYPDPVRPGALVTHRIDRVLEDGTYRTRGDANRVPDPAPLDPGDIVGVGRLLVPAVGLPVAWFEHGHAGLAVAWLLSTAAAAWLALGPASRDGRPRRRRRLARPVPVVERC